MFNLNEKKKEIEYVELPKNFVVEHETEKGILIKDGDTANANWFGKCQVKLEGDKIKIPRWLYEKEELFNRVQGDSEA